MEIYSRTRNLPLLLLSSSFVLLQSFAVFAAAPEAESKALALKGARAWSAFECSAFASIEGNEKEQERLFELGYREGKAFLKAIRDKKIRNEDISSIVPIGLTWVMQGPNDDFILGRVFESAMDNALKDILTTDGKYNQKELQKVLASGKYDQCNCKLLVAPQP